MPRNSTTQPPVEPEPEATGTVLLQHPTFPDVQQEIPAKQAADWLDAGWIRTEAAQPDTDPDQKG